MRKIVFIFAFVCLALSGCRSKYNGYSNGYGTSYYSTSPYYSYYSTSPYGNSNYTGYSYYNTGYQNDPYNYNPSYNYNPNYYYDPYYNWTYPYRGVNRRWYRNSCGTPYCQVAGMESKLNLSLESPQGSTLRNVVGGNLRTQVFGKRTEVEYVAKNENLKFLNENGKTFVSGTLLADGQKIAINPNSQACTTVTSKFSEDSRFNLVKVHCQDPASDTKIQAEVLIPEYQQGLTGKSEIAKK